MQPNNDLARDLLFILLGLLTVIAAAFTVWVIKLIIDWLARKYTRTRFKFGDLVAPKALIDGSTSGLESKFTFKVVGISPSGDLVRVLYADSSEVWYRTEHLVLLDSLATRPLAGGKVGF